MTADARPASVRDQLLHDIFVTAIEGGMTTAWSRVVNYHWGVPATDADPSHSFEDDVLGFYADLDEYGDDSEPAARHHVDRTVIERGLRLAADEWRNKIHWQCGYKPPFFPEDEWEDFDAFDADCVLQLGLFREVIYG